MTSDRRGLAPSRLRASASRWWAAARHPVHAVALRVSPWPPIRLFVATTRLFVARRGLQHAAEIAYFAVLSLIPFGVVVLTLLAYAAVDVLATGWTLEDLSTVVSRIVPELLPGDVAYVEQVIATLIRDRGALGAVGVAALLITARFVFAGVNGALAAIFNVKGRSPVTTMVLFAVFLTTVALLVIFVVNAATAWMALVGDGAQGTLADRLERNRVVLHVATDFFLLLAFIFFMRSAVRTRVGTLDAIVGALVFVMLFEAARAAYAYYLQTIAQFGVLYGSLAGTMASLVWVFYVAAVLLWAMCFTRVRHDDLHRTEMGDLARTGRS